MACTGIIASGAIDLLQALELHHRRREVFLQDADFASEAGAPGVQQALLQIHGGHQAVVIPEALEQFGIVVHHIAAVAFRFQAVFYSLADDVLGADRTLAPEPEFFALGIKIRPFVKLKMGEPPWQVGMSDRRKRSINLLSPPQIPLRLPTAEKDRQRSGSIRRWI
jgi:hypothetical protein